MDAYITIWLQHLPYKSGPTISFSKLDDKVGDERKLVFAGAVIVRSHMTPTVVIADFRSHDKFIGNLNSRLKCNTCGPRKDFGWGPIGEAFPGSIIQFLHDRRKSVCRDRGEIRLFREIIA